MSSSLLQSVEVCDEEATMSSIDQMLTSQSYILLGLAIAAFFVNALFLCFVAKGCRAEELPVKRFLFVSNRAAADLMTSLVAFFYLQKSVRTECKRTPLGCQPVDSDGVLLENLQHLMHPFALQVAITLDYWMVSLSHSGVALLTAYAVRDPINYKLQTKLTMRHIYYCLAISWGVLILFLSIIYGIQWTGVLGGQQGNTTWSLDIFDTNGMIYIMMHGYFKNEVSYWQADLCSNIQRLQPFFIALLALAVPGILLGLAIFSYGMVANALCTRRDAPVFRHNRGALLRLGMHLFIFTSTFIVMGSAYLNTVPMKESCLSSSLPRCDRLEPLHRYSILSILSSIAWFSRMIADPLIDVLVDGVLRRSVFPRKRHRLSTITTSTKDECYKLHRQSTIDPPPQQPLLALTQV